MGIEVKYGIRQSGAYIDKEKNVIKIIDFSNKNGEPTVHYRALKAGSKKFPIQSETVKSFNSKDEDGKTKYRLIGIDFDN